MCFFLFGGMHGHKKVKDLNEKILRPPSGTRTHDVCMYVRMVFSGIVDYVIVTQYILIVSCRCLLWLSIKF